MTKGDTVVQIGTPNIHTLKRFSRLVGARGCVVIVEAEPSNSRRLKNDIVKRGIDNVHIVELGAWSSEGSILLHKSDDFDGDHKIEVPNIHMDNDFRTGYEKKIEIKVDTVDNILEGLSVAQINYLSITVNGAEFEVLKGCVETLRRSVDIRVYAKGHARQGDSGNGEPLNVPISSFLQDMGYSLVLTHGEKSTAGIDSWVRRDGDVFGWKTPSTLIM
jgi:FkbM family methyltransferase